MVNKHQNKQALYESIMRKITPIVRKAILESEGINKPGYVDLGLPSGTLWATCNLGANSPEDSGLYFALGETKGYSAEQVGTDKIFYKRDYEHIKNYRDPYDTDNRICDYDGILKPEFDAATVNLGSEWRMPTKDEIEELLKLENEWIEDYDGTGVEGRQFVGNNGNTLFLPATGCAEAGRLDCVGGYGGCWSSTLNEYGERSAYLLDFCEVKSGLGIEERYLGFTIRPVRG